MWTVRARPRTLFKGTKPLKMHHLIPSKMFLSFLWNIDAPVGIELNAKLQIWGDNILCLQWLELVCTTYRNYNYKYVSSAGSLCRYIFHKNYEIGSKRISCAHNDLCHWVFGSFSLWCVKTLVLRIISVIIVCKARVPWRVIRALFVGQRGHQVFTWGKCPQSSSDL